MQDSDRFTKILLVILVVGVWGLLVRTFFPASPSEPQPKAAAQSQSQRQFAVVSVDDAGKYKFDGSGSSIGLTGSGLVNALDEVNRQGLRVHSIVTPNSGGYVVIVER